MFGTVTATVTVTLHLLRLPKPRYAMIHAKSISRSTRLTHFYPYTVRLLTNGENPIRNPVNFKYSSVQQINGSHFTPQLRRYSQYDDDRKREQKKLGKKSNMGLLTTIGFGATFLLGKGKYVLGALKLTVSISTIFILHIFLKSSVIYHI